LIQRIEKLLNPEAFLGTTRYFINPHPLDPKSKPVLYKTTRSKSREYDLDISCVSREHADEDILINNEIEDNDITFSNKLENVEDKTTNHTDKQNED